MAKTFNPKDIISMNITNNETGESCLDVDLSNDKAINIPNVIYPRIDDLIKVVMKTMGVELELYITPQTYQKMIELEYNKNNNKEEL